MHSLTCDHCDKTATCNYQKIWVRFSYNAKTGDYGRRSYSDELNEDPSGDDNMHLCKEHEEQFLNGDL